MSRYNYPTPETVERIRKQYPKGTRVKLIRMNDPYTQMEPGTLGTVIEVDDLATVHIAWETGSSLGAVYGEDRITKA